MVIDTLKIILPLLVAFGLGVFCRKVNMVNEEGNFCLKDMLANIMFPAMLFNSFLFAEYHISSIVYVIATFLSFLITFLIIKFGKICIKGYEKYSPILMTTWEGGSVGISFCNLLYGTVGVTTMALLDLGHAFFLFAIIVPLLRVMDGGKSDVKNIFKIIITTPAFDAILLGLILGLLNVDKLLAANESVYEIYSGIQGIISAPVNFVMMFAIGNDFNINKKTINQVLKTIGIRIIFFAMMCAVVSFVIFRFIPFSKQILLTTIVAFALPQSFGLPSFSRFEGSREYVASTISLNTLFTILVFTVVLLIR